MVLQIPPGHIVGAIVPAQRQLAIPQLFDSRSSICEELLWCHFISLPPPLRACLYYLVARQACKVVPVSFPHQCLYCLFVCIVYCLYCLLFILFILSGGTACLQGQYQCLWVSLINSASGKKVGRMCDRSCWARRNWQGNSKLMMMVMMIMMMLVMTVIYMLQLTWNVS